MAIFKRIFFISVTCILLYAMGAYIYFSSTPRFKDYCPNLIDISLENKLFPGHTFKIINDFSCLNPTRVYDIIKITTIHDIYKALELAHNKNLHISISGIRHCLGGQAFFKDALILDMTDFNQIISLDEKNKIIKVQSGATWHDIQLFLHAKNLAVKSMQSSDIFTVGGSLSVNAHGMDPKVGPIASTVKSFTFMFADGTIKNITRQEDAELFNAIIGGYGLFGIILEVELEVTDNVMYQTDINIINYQSFPEFFENAKKNNSYDLFYAHLSTSPLSFLKECIVYGYKIIENPNNTFTPLRSTSLVNIRRFLLNLSKKRTYAQILKWFAEKYIDPYIAFPPKRASISRNHIMHDSVEYLQNILANETDILQEYFVPQDKFIEFIDGVRDILQNRKSLILNASIRVVPKQSIMLNYAPQDMFALVLYLNQRINKKALENMQELTQELINFTIKLNGTFFLPYQLHFTKEQLHKAYPKIDQFFELKKKHDPTMLFMNQFYNKYTYIT